VIREARDVLALMYKGVPDKLDLLDIPLPKPRKPRTSEQLAATAAKIRATREARGTTSKKQKAQIHGNVTGVTITPVTSGTTVASAPAASASANGSSTPSVGVTVAGTASTHS
jgi:hypothetical protein